MTDTQAAHTAAGSNAPPSPPAASAASAAPTLSRVVFGMPVSLLWGYIAMAIFMTGDGIELAYLSTHLFDAGHSAQQVSLVFTLYALAAAISSWLSGGISEIYGPRRIMLIGAAWWILLHAVFVLFGVAANHYPAILASYTLRGFAYPLFFYGFYVLVVQRTPAHRLASATGWIWSMFTIGYGICASFVAGALVPRVGFVTTLWLSTLFAAVGGLMIVWLVRERSTPQAGDTGDTGDTGGTSHPGHPVTRQDKLREIARGLTLAFEDRSMFLALVIRILCNLALFGLPVFMPIHFTRQLGFSGEQWASIWGVFFLIQPFTNVLWGICGDRIGWLFQMRWFGFVGSAVATAAFYVLPSAFPGNLWVAMGCAVLLAITLTAFVPMGAIFPSLAPRHQGAAVSVQNLGGGLGNLIGPAVVTLLFSLSFDSAVVIATFSVLYLLGAVLTCFIRDPQPAIRAAAGHSSSTQPAPQQGQP